MSTLSSTTEAFEMLIDQQLRTALRTAAVFYETWRCTTFGSAPGQRAPSQAGASWQARHSARVALLEGIRQAQDDGPLSGRQRP